MSKKIKISELHEYGLNDNINFDAVVSKITEVDTSGKYYNQTIVEVEDLTGKTKFPIWKPKEVVERDLNIFEGNIYNFYGKVNEFRGEKQLKYTGSQILDDKEEIRKAIDPNFYKGVTEEQKKTFYYIIENKFDDPRYKRLVEVALGLGDVPEGVGETEYRERLKKFMSWPASISHHDNYDGGLFNHSVGLAVLVLKIKERYATAKSRRETKSKMNWDHLLALAFLHDYDKIKEYYKDENGRWQYNGNVLIDHKIEGATTVVKFANEVEEELRLDNDKLELLRYGILCHHGQWGDFEPLSNEDKVFHALDLIEACNVDMLTIS